MDVYYGTTPTTLERIQGLHNTWSWYWRGPNYERYEWYEVYQWYRAWTSEEPETWDIPMVWYEMHDNRYHRCDSSGECYTSCLCEEERERKEDRRKRVSPKFQTQYGHSTYDELSARGAQHVYDEFVSEIFAFTHTSLREALDYYYSPCFEYWGTWGSCWCSSSQSPIVRTKVETVERVLHKPANLVSQFRFWGDAKDKNGGLLIPAPLLTLRNYLYEILWRSVYAFREDTLEVQTWWKAGTDPLSSYTTPEDLRKVQQWYRDLVSLLVLLSATSEFPQEWQVLGTGIFDPETRSMEDAETPVLAVRLQDPSMHLTCEIRDKFLGRAWDTLTLLLTRYSTGWLSTPLTNIMTLDDMEDVEWFPCLEVPPHMFPSRYYSYHKASLYPSEFEVYTNLQDLLPAMSPKEPERYILRYLGCPYRREDVQIMKRSQSPNSLALSSSLFFQKFSIFLFTDTELEKEFSGHRMISRSTEHGGFTNPDLVENTSYEVYVKRVDFKEVDIGRSGRWKKVDIARDSIFWPYVRVMLTSPGVNKIVVGHLGPIEYATFSRVLSDPLPRTRHDYYTAAEKFGKVLNECSWLKDEPERFVSLYSDRDDEEGICVWSGSKDGFEELRGYDLLRM